MNGPSDPITPRGIEINVDAGLPLDAPLAARTLLRTARAAAVSTLDAGTGHPYGSVTNLATDHDGTPIMLMAGLALHTRNVLADPRVALTLARLGAGDALAQPRLVLLGHARRADGETRARYERRYLMAHPKGQAYVNLPDSMFFGLEITGVKFSGGPGRNAGTVTPQDLACSLADAETLLAAEAGAIEHLNADHAEALALYARTLGGGAGRWRATGLDPEGLDLAKGHEALRLWFPQRLTTPQALRQELAMLAQRARASLADAS